MHIKRILSALLLCTTLWINACGESSEILTVEMDVAYIAEEPILVSVILPASWDVSELLFQIDGTVYTVQSLPTPEEPLFHLTAEDGIQTAFLFVSGFYEEAATVQLQLFPNTDERYYYMKYVWFSKAAEFAPLWDWLQMAQSKIEP